MKNFSFLLLVLFLWSCGNEQNTTENTTVDEVNVESETMQSFINFYQKFLRDSAYQLAHIQFPIEVLPSNDDTTLVKGQTVYREAKDWKIHKAFTVEDSGFQSSFIPFSETVMIENITHTSGAFRLQRRFAYLHDGWYLIYYAEMQRK